MIRAVSPFRAPMGGPGPGSPPMKATKSPFDDGCSTVAPSPAPTSLLMSPAPCFTPSQSSFSPFPSSPGPFSKPAHDADLPLPDQPLAWELPTAVSDCDFFELAMEAFADGLDASLIIPAFGAPPAVEALAIADSSDTVPVPQNAKTSATDDFFAEIEKCCFLSPLASPRSPTEIMSFPAGAMGGCHTPPGAPRRTPLHPLLAALSADSYEQVRYALYEDPEVAASVFLDHNWEPPLCAAVRLGCDEEIVELLINHGADVNATDMKGRTPLTILSSRQTRCNETDHEVCELLASLPLASNNHMSLCFEHVRACAIKHDLRVAEVLAKAGADPRLPDERGKYPSDLARICGNNHLVHFWA